MFGTYEVVGKRDAAVFVGNNRRTKDTLGNDSSLWYFVAMYLSLKDSWIVQSGVGHIRGSDYDRDTSGNGE